MPPTTLAIRRPRQWRTRSMASWATCWASSRVGHSTRAPGVAALKLRVFVGSLRLGRLGGASPLAIAAATAASNSSRSRLAASTWRCSKVCSTGSRKAAVLPLPVWLDTSRSVKPVALSAVLDTMAMGITFSCTAVGWVNSISATALTSSGARPSLAKPLGTTTAASAGTTSAATATGASAAKDSMEEEESKDCAGAKSPCTSNVSVIFFSHESQPRRSQGVLRQWLKNINHQTEPG